MFGRYFSACNAIDNHNRMWQSESALKKYWVTQSGYFRLADTKLLFYHGISDKIGYKNISMREYNKKDVCDCFKYHFPVDCSSPY